MSKRKKFVAELVTTLKQDDKSQQGVPDVSQARDRLKGALQDLLEHSDDSSMSSHDDASHLDFTQHMVLKRESNSIMTTGQQQQQPQQQQAQQQQVQQQQQPHMSQGLRNFRTQRKRRRRETVSDAAFHHTYVMKLFDRSVDLAQFKEDTPLYPICRAWMANQPRNTNLVPKMRTPTPPPPEDSTSGPEGGDSDSESVRDTYKMPPPIPLDRKRNIRIPSPVPQPKNLPSGASEQEPKLLSRESLLQSHVAHWTAVRKKWHSASNANEARYAGSTKILKAIFKKAQKQFE